MIHPPSEDQTVWAYVVEDPETKKITDFASFYRLESTVIQHDTEKNIKAAYLYYYATEKAFTATTKELKEHLKLLMNDVLILAKKVSLALSQLLYYSSDHGDLTDTVYFFSFNRRTSTLLTR